MTSPKEEPSLPDTPDEILTVEGVVKAFGALRAVDGIGFSVRRGEIFGVAGPNGSGKSTLFNLITSIPFAADSGSIRFEGVAIERMAPHRICRLGVARTFQKDAEFSTLSVYDNVVTGAVYGREGRGAGDDRQAAHEALAFVGLPGSDHDRLAGELSVFDKKRLMIASALAARPRLLLLDEPASGLTKPEIDSLIHLIRRINATGVTVLLIEHVLPLLLTVSQRLMVLNQGRVLTTGLPDDVVRDDRVIEAYLGSRGRRDDAAA
jgi:branched-chain amino acid transport system ATP-binding protein